MVRSSHGVRPQRPPFLNSVNAGGGGLAASASFAMAQLADANRIYQRLTTAGGGGGKGQGGIVVSISGATAGTIVARLRFASDGVTVAQAEWQAATITGGATSALVLGVDVLLGWYYLDLKGADGAWQLGTVPISVGRLVEVTGQSLALDLFTNYHDTGTTLASLGITANDNGRAYWHGDDAPGRVAATAGWQKPGDGAAMTTTNSAAAAEFLNLQIAAFGCNVGLIGVAKGSTAIAVWQSGQTYGTQTQTVLNATGNLFEASFWFQGHSDAGDGSGVGANSYAGYKTALDNLFTFKNTLNSRGYTKYLAAIPNINYASNWGNWRTRAMVRKAQEDWCAANSATYLPFADLELYSDGVHLTQLGARRVARHLHRATLAEISSANDNGPRIASATRSGVDITLPVTHSLGSALVGVGTPATRFRVIKAGDPTYTALALDATTPITIAAGQITIKLAADPGTGVPLEIWPMAEAVVNDGSASAIYDNADAEGFGRGRQLYAKPTPVRTKHNHTLNTNVSTLVTAYAAGKFGNGRSSGEMQATINGLAGGLAYSGATLECWVTVNSVNTGSAAKVYCGQGNWAWIGQNNANPVFAVGSVLTTSSATLVAGQTYHFRLCVDPDSKSWRLYVNGVQTDALTNQNPTFGIDRIFTIGGFANGGGVGQYHYTQGVIDEVAVFNKALTTGTSFTVPTAPYAGNEADLLHLWHCDGDGVDAAA